MDAIALEVLRQELAADARVLQDAARLARARLGDDTAAGMEACGYQLSRYYNVLERMFERVGEAFENQFERRGDFHERLLIRMSLDLPGIRPRLLEPADLQRVRELKGFRHLFRHAYDLQLRPDRLAELVPLAEQFVIDLPLRCEAFLGSVQASLE